MVFRYYRFKKIDFFLARPWKEDIPLGDCPLCGSRIVYWYDYFSFPLWFRNYVSCPNCGWVFKVFVELKCIFEETEKVIKKEGVYNTYYINCFCGNKIGIAYILFCDEVILECKFCGRKNIRIIPRVILCPVLPEECEKVRKRYEEVMDKIEKEKLVEGGK